jgi:hypothetical protein
MTRYEIKVAIRSLQHRTTTAAITKRKELVRKLNEMDAEVPKEENYDPDPAAVVNNALNGWQD